MAAVLLVLVGSWFMGASIPRDFSLLDYLVKFTSSSSHLDFSFQFLAFSFQAFEILGFD